MTIKKKVLKSRGLNEPTASKHLIGVFFALMLLSCIYLCLPPVTNAADSNPVDPDLLNRALSDLNDIIGIDMKQYTITQSSQRKESNILQVAFQVVDLRLATLTSTVRITIYYTKNTLTQVYVSDLEDSSASPATLKMRFPAINPDKMVIDMLVRYQEVTGDNEYGAIANGSFKNIQLTTNSTDEKGNASFMWVYCIDGVTAERKNICISYEHGSLKYFMNNWPIYTIANPTNNLTEAQAQQIALNFMKQYYYNYTFSNGTTIKVSNFSISNKSYIGHTNLIFINSADAISARGGDQTVFYLAWYVPMGFDRWYPGGVSIIPVILWSDTGQVCSPAFVWEAPEITVFGLENATYSGSVPLNFSVSESTVWMGYSLDGGDNVTVAGNFTLNGLATGSHNLTLYANDSFENVGASETVVFTVVSEPFPVVLVTALVVVAAIVAAGLLVYRKRNLIKRL